ncbi:unnamed protein product [Protopolystoma xenopodis]|uniref:Uncharacterized protein n=1 Tax=Protopolystoma xenopodis TaxID=117903 RepID=A0A3S4ZJ82_9PLAT|nr:unnamed protein product [Protopolystoma xenopodis]
MVPTPPRPCKPRVSLQNAPVPRKTGRRQEHARGWSEKCCSRGGAQCAGHRRLAGDKVVTPWRLSLQTIRQNACRAIDLTCLNDEFVAWRGEWQHSLMMSITTPATHFENVPSRLSDAGDHDNYYGRRLRTRCVLPSRLDNKTKLRQGGQPTFLLYEMSARGPRSVSK